MVRRPPGRSIANDPGPGPGPRNRARTGGRGSAGSRSVSRTRWAIRWPTTQTIPLRSQTSGTDRSIARGTRRPRKKSLSGWLRPSSPSGSKRSPGLGLADDQGEGQAVEVDRLVAGLVGVERRRRSGPVPSSPSPGTGKGDRLARWRRSGRIRSSEPGSGDRASTSASIPAPTESPTDPKSPAPPAAAIDGRPSPASGQPARRQASRRTSTRSTGSSSARAGRSRTTRSGPDSSTIPAQPSARRAAPGPGSSPRRSGPAGPGPRRRPGCTSRPARGAVRGGSGPGSARCRGSSSPRGTPGRSPRGSRGSRPGDAQQGPDQRHARRQSSPRRHPRQPPEPGPPDDPVQDRLRLVVERLPDRHDEAPRACATPASHS